MVPQLRDFFIVPGQHTLGKQERLKSRKQTEQLFREGKKFMSGSIRVIYHVVPAGREGLLFGAGASVKLFRKAVDRNRIKRILREVYRLQKSSMEGALKEKQRQLNLFFLYTGKEMPDYHQLYDLAGKAINKLNRVISEIK